MSIDATNSSAATPGSQLGAIGNVRAGIDASANAWIVKPSLKGAIGDFVFDIEESYSISADSEITENYTEKNDNFSDHIVRRPLEVTFRGFVGEVMRKKASGLTGALSIIQDRLGVIPAYLGKYTPFQLQKMRKAVTAAENVVTAIDQALLRADNIAKLFKGDAPGETRQAKAFMKLLGYRDQGTIFQLDGPYSRLTKTINNNQPADRNFVIKRLVATQEGDTREMSDFSLTLKEINFIPTNEDPTANMSPIAAAGRAKPVNRGVTKGVFEPFDLAKLRAGAGMKAL